MDLKEIQNLIKFVAKSGANEVSLETEEFKITVKTGGETVYTAAPTVVQATAPVKQAAAPAPAAAPEAASPAPAEDDSKYITVKSPMIGTFYRRASPDKPTFI